MQIVDALGMVVDDNAEVTGRQPVSDLN